METWLVCEVVEFKALRVETNVAFLADVSGPPLAHPEIIVIVVVVVVVVVVIVVLVVVSPAHRVIVNVLDHVANVVLPHVVSTSPSDHQRPTRLDSVRPVNLQ